MRHRKTSQAARVAALTAVEPRALAFIAGAAAAIIALTLRTWVDFDTAHLRGTDANALTNVGDGYFVIALAIVAIACAAALYLRPTFWAWLLPGIGISAVGIAAIAAYDAATPWHAAGFDISGAFVVGGHATAAVYEVFALASAIGLVAGMLASSQYGRRRSRSESSEDGAHLTVKGSRHDEPNPRSTRRFRTR